MPAGWWRFIFSPWCKQRWSVHRLEFVCALVRGCMRPHAVVSSCVWCWLGLQQALTGCRTLLVVEILKKERGVEEEKPCAESKPLLPLCFTQTAWSLSVAALISWLGRSPQWHMCLDHVRQHWNYVGRGSSCLWKRAMAARWAAQAENSFQLAQGRIRRRGTGPNGWARPLFR